MTGAGDREQRDEMLARLIGDIRRRGGIVLDLDGQERVDVEILKTVMAEFAAALADDLAEALAIGGAPAEAADKFRAMAEAAVRGLVARIAEAFPTIN